MQRWGYITLLVASLLLLPGAGLAQQGDSVSGAVIDEGGPVAGARVRLRATDFATVTDEAGRFTLSEVPTGQEIDITAWAVGYYIAYLPITPPAHDVTLLLRRHHTEDHPDYAWAAPQGDPGEGEAGGCAACHPSILPQWAANAHGTAINNARFYSLYNGTDLSGERPVGSGYVLDFPGTAGVCASCHAPGAGVDGYLRTDMNDVRGEVTAGIYVNPANAMPYPNAPGVESQRLLRPPAGDNIFLGPYDDIHDPDTYLPAMRESAFCAPCHQFSMWGVPIYESYAEWLASPYAGVGITCQQCHMPPNSDATFATVEAGGLPHPPEQIASHLQLGATSETLLQNTVEMTMGGSNWSMMPAP